MPWVNRSGYSPGKRHFVASVERVWGETELRDYTDRNAGVYQYDHFVDHATPALCNNTPGEYRGKTSGYLCTNLTNGKRVHSYGGLSVVEQVNLMQRNLCAYCIKKFLAEVRPDLLPAYTAMKTGRVET